MSSEPASGSAWTPSWRRLAGSTVVLFVVILALLVGRVRAGADPGLAGTTTPAPQPQTQPQSTPGFDPGTGSSGTGSSGGSDDNFGNAVPNGSGSTGAGSDGTGQGNQSADPPSTHVS